MISILNMTNLEANFALIENGSNDVYTQSQVVISLLCYVRVINHLSERVAYVKFVLKMHNNIPLCSKSNSVL